MARQDCAVIWIHGPQPVLLSSPESILQKIERRPGAIRLYSIEVIPGRNKIAEKIGYGPSYGEAPRWGALAQDLSRLVGGQDPSTGLIVGSRRKVDQSKLQEPQSVPKTSDHLVRLWARDRIMKLFRSSTKERVERRRGARPSLSTRYARIGRRRAGDGQGLCSRRSGAARRHKGSQYTGA